MKIKILTVAAVIVFIATGVLFALYFSGMGASQINRPAGTAATTIKPTAALDEKVTVSQKSFQLLGKSEGDDENLEGPYFYGSYCFEVTNTTDSTIALDDDYAVTFLNSKGRILKTEQSYGFAPKIIQPGEKSYAGADFYIETIKKETDIAKMEVSVNFQKTTKKEVLLTIENISILETLAGKIRITGQAINKTDSYIYPTIIAASFDKKGKLLDVSESFNAPSELRPGRKLPFEIDLQNEKVKKSDIANVKVFGVSDPDMGY